MTCQKMYFRFCMLYEFNQGESATVATKAICSIFDDNSVGVRICQIGLHGFVKKI